MAFLIATTANTNQKYYLSLTACEEREKKQRERVSGNWFGLTIDRKIQREKNVCKSIKLLAAWKMDGAAHKEITILNYHLYAVQMVSVTTQSPKRIIISH